MPNVHTSHVNSVFCLDILNQALFEVLRHCPTKTEEEKLYILKIFSPKNCLFRVQVLRRPRIYTSPHCFLHRERQANNKEKTMFSMKVTLR